MPIVTGPCVLVREGLLVVDIIIQTSHIVLKLTNVYVDYMLSRHAEIAAIMKLPPGTNMHKVTLIVVRHGMKMSKPCEKCDMVIRGLGIRKVYYSQNGILEKLKLK